MSTKLIEELKEKFKDNKELQNVLSQFKTDELLLTFIELYNEIQAKKS